MPSTSRGITWQGSNWIRSDRRLALYARDGWRCTWCGATSHLSLDHLWPCASSTWDNQDRALVTCCLRCNGRRGALRLSSWLRQLRRDGVSLGPVVARLRVQLRTPADRREGARLAQDPAVRAARRRAGRVLRGSFLDQQGAECVPF